MANDSSTASNSRPIKRNRLRIAGVAILLLGVFSAALLYWAQTRSPDLSDNPAMIQFSKPQKRQMGIMYGPMGNLIEDLSDDVKRPGVQAALVVGVSAVVSVGCFILGRSPENSDAIE